MGEKILEQENVGIWKQLCHERSLALLQMWGCQGCDSSFLLLTTYLIWYDSTNSQESLIFYVIPSSLGLSNGWNVLVNKSPHLDKVNFIEGNVCVVIHSVRSPFSSQSPITLMNTCLMWRGPNIHTMSSNSVDRIYWLITSDDENLVWIDFMNNINWMSDNCWSSIWFWY